MTTARTIDCHTHILTEEAMRLLAKQSPKVAPMLKKRRAAAARSRSTARSCRTRCRARYGTSICACATWTPMVWTFRFCRRPCSHSSTATNWRWRWPARPSRTRRSRPSSAGSPIGFSVSAASRYKRRSWRPMNSRRSMTKLGLRGAMIGTNVNGRNLDDPALEPFWAAAETLGAFLFVHPMAASAVSGWLLLHEEHGRASVRNHDCRRHVSCSAACWSAIRD